MALTKIFFYFDFSLIFALESGGFWVCRVACVKSSPAPAAPALKEIESYPNIFFPAGLDFDLLKFA